MQRLRIVVRRRPLPAAARRAQRGAAPRCENARIAQRITFILAATIAAGLLAGCGGKGQQTTTIRVTQTAAATPGSSPGAGPTRAEALAYAHAVNITAADVPGLHASTKPAHRSSSGKTIERELARCVGVTGGQQIAEAGSPNFERSAGITQFDVSSNVSVSQSAAIAAAELAKLRSPHAKACMQRYVRELFQGTSGRGVIVGPVAVAAGTPPAPGASASVGLRISTSITVKTIRIPFYLDILEFVYGPAAVSLLSSGVPVPFPASAEERLFVSLLARAKANALGPG